MTYSEQLKHPNWQRKRLEIMQRDDFMCRMCGDSEVTLHIHHRSYEKGRMAWDYPNENFCTLCEGCHKLVTDTNKRICAATDFEPTQFALVQALDFMENAETFGSFVNLMGFMSRDAKFAKAVFDMVDAKITADQNNE